jgi:hypothetical protein
MGHLTLSEYRSNPYTAPGQLAAVKIGRLAGRNVYRVPVYIRANDSRLCATVARGWTTVTAYGAADAANWVRGHIDRPETEVVAIGPKGGEAHRYIGWHSYIGGAVLNGARRPHQLQLI